MERDYAAKLIQNKKPSQKIKIDGIGTVEVYGEWNAEKIIKKLLEYKEITG